MATSQGQTNRPRDKKPTLQTAADKQTEKLSGIYKANDEGGADDNDKIPWTKTSVKLFSSPITHSYAASSARVHLLIVSFRIPPTLSKIYLIEKERFTKHQKTIYKNCGSSCKYYTKQSIPLLFRKHLTWLRV